MTNQASRATGLSLDDLLSESMEQQAAKVELKNLQRRVKSGQASQAERVKAQEQEIKLSWRATALCEMWEQFNCQCGHTFAYFSQHMMEYQQASGKGASKRWQAYSTEGKTGYEALPKKAIFNMTETYACNLCSGPDEGAEVIIWENSSRVEELEGPEADADEPEAYSDDELEILAQALEARTVAA